MKRFLSAIFFIAGVVSSYAQVTISMENKGGVYYIPGKVNGLPLEFIFDTGASDVYISMTEALFMLKNGYITDSDFGDRSYAQIADGSMVENTEINLREIEVAGLTIKNVKAYVSNSLNAPLLFGQSAIQKLGPIQINGNQLTIGNGKSLPLNEKAFSLYQKAYQECEAGNYDNAIKLSKQALDICSDKKLRAVLYDNIAYAYYHSDRKAEAINALNAALGEDMMSEQPAYNLGVYYFEMGEIAKSLRAFDVFIDRHKNTKNTNMLAAAYAYKGDCHSTRGEIKDAENAYSRSLSLIPHTQALLGLADLYLDAGRYSDAVRLYKSALEYEPNRMSNIKRHHQLGYCYARLDMRAEAEDAFRNCLTALAENKDLMDYAMKSGDEDMERTAINNMYLGFTAELWIGRLTSNPSETVSIFERIYEIPGISEEFVFKDYLDWAYSYTANGETPRSMAKALEVLKKGLIALPDNPEILFSCALYTDSNSSEHLEYLMQVLNHEYKYTPIFFDYGTVYNNIAWHYVLNNNYQEALPYAQIAVNKNPEHIYSWDTIGEIYFYLGKYEESIDAFGHCLSSEEPDQLKKAHKFRGESYMQLGKKKEAQRELNLAK